MTAEKHDLIGVLSELRDMDLLETDASRASAELNRILQKATLSPEDQSIVNAILAIVTNAISARQLSKDRIVESQIINELNLNIITTLDEKKIIRQIETAARKMLSTDRILLFYLTGDRLISINKTIGLARMPAEFYYQIFNYRHIFTSDYPKHRFLDSILGSKARQVTFVPFTIKNEVHGFFLLYEDPTKYHWNAVITRLRFLANQASIALERVELIRALNFALRETQGLQSLIKMMISTLDLPSLFNNLINQAHKIIGFNRILLSIYDPKTECFNRVSNAGISAPLYKRAKAIHPPLAAISVLFQNRYRISNSYYIPAGKVPLSVRKYELYSSPVKTKTRVANMWQNGDVLISPISSKNRDLLGYLSLDVPVNNLAPSTERIKLIETFGDFLGLAIENNQLFEKVERLSNTDELTGIYNYRFLRDRMSAFIKDDASPFSIIMIDLDKFKEYNDEYGHLRGDEILREISRLLVRTVADDGHVTRYGGDEFIILLPATDGRAALNYVRRISNNLAQDGATRPMVDFSFGIACFPKDGINFGQLIDCADKLVYDEKARKSRDVGS